MEIEIVGEISRPETIAVGRRMRGRGTLVRGVWYRQEHEAA